MKTKLTLIVFFFVFQFSFANSFVSCPNVLSSYPSYQLCDSSGATGYESFDLSSQVSTILMGQAGMTVTFYPSITAAQNNTNPITNPSSYINTAIYTQTIGIRVTEIATGCSGISSMDIKVLPLPNLIAPIAPYTVCDDNQDGIAVFDLSSLIPSLLNGGSYSITFHETITDALVNSTAIPFASSYTNIIPFTQTIYARGADIITGCSTIQPIELQVNPSPIAGIVPSLAVCNSDSNPTNAATSFNLTQQTALILAMQPIAASNYTVMYYATISNAVNGTEPIFPATNYIGSNGESIWYRVENNISGCYNVGSFQLVVNVSPVATIPNEYHLCDIFGVVGYENFNLTSIIPEVIGSSIDPSSVVVSFYVTLSDAQNGINQIGSVGTWENTTLWEQTLYVRVVVVSTGCYDVVPLHLIVDPLPQLIAPSSPYPVCDDNQDGTAAFDLTTLIPGLLNGGTYSLTFHETLTDALVYTGIIYTPSSYVNITPFTQTIYARGADINTGCSTIQPIELQVNPSPIAGVVPSLEVCDSDANPANAMTSVNLTQQTALILAMQPIAASNYTVMYYTTISDAINGIGPIFPATNYIGSNGESIWYRVENNSSSCYNVGSFQLAVYASPNMTLVSNNTLNTVYVDGLNNVVQSLILDAQLIGNYTFTWEVDGAPIPGAISSVYTVNTASPTGASRTFVVSATNLITGCTDVSSIVVAQSSGTPSPRGAIMQLYNPGDTLANLTVVGSNILWYASASGKNATTINSTPLPLSTLLQNATTYYASQSIGGFESIARLPVTVYAALGVPGNEITSLQFAPNPVKSSLTIKSDVVIKSISVYTMLGQKIFEQIYNDTNISIDLSRLTTGNYILKAQGEAGQKNIRIIKE